MNIVDELAAGAQRDPFDNAVLFDGVDGVGDALISAQSGTPYDVPVNIPQPAIPTPNVPAAPAANTSIFQTFNQTLANVTGTALAVLQAKQAWRAASAPSPRTVDVSSATGTTKTPESNGYLTVRNADGRVIGREMPQRGVPYALANGTVIMNNGNGTFVRISPNGAQTTVRYGTPAPRTTGPGSGGAPLFGAGGGFGSTAALIVGVIGLLGAAFYFSGRRGRG